MRRRTQMQSNYFKTLKTAVRAVTVLLFWTSLAAGQQQVNLTAGPTTLSLPDGSSVPMWGYSCGAPVSGSTASCAKANPAAAGWSPVVITVPTGQGLTINLTNNLVFANGNSVPTSLTIVGLLGGGLGTPGGFTAPPARKSARARPCRSLGLQATYTPERIFWNPARIPPSRVPWGCTVSS